MATTSMVSKIGTGLGRALVLLLVLFSFMTVALPAHTAHAAPNDDAKKQQDKDKKKDGKDPNKHEDTTPTPTGAGKNCSQDNDHCDLITLYVNPLINVLSIVVGLVVAASIIMGGIQYTASSGDPQKTAAAKSRIQNALLAFFAYAFLYAFLNFLIPGGLFQ